MKEGKSMEIGHEQQELLSKIERYIKQANNEEMGVLSAIIEGLEKKQNGDYLTYLAGITSVKSQFIDEDTYEVTIPIQPLIENPLKIVHGGITATLLDTAMGAFINRLLPEDSAAVTSEIKINYLTPGIGTTLRCLATIAHKGKKLWVAEAKVYSDTNKLVAMASGSFFIIPRR
ncbi:PaaI family thioesterase [Anaerobacillus sp. MEB173]|uniref:PaaI family thioesterase n=1 Tax=Anaerobacillus sp. MEB173 TaxID=3383345 RepID=UPI003F904654